MSMETEPGTEGTCIGKVGCIHPYILPIRFYAGFSVLGQENAGLFLLYVSESVLHNMQFNTTSTAFL